MTDRNKDRGEDNIPQFSQNTLKMADEKVGIVELCSGTTGDGNDFYAYVNIKPSHYEAYAEACEKGEAIDLLAIGTVLETGEGKTPPEEVKRRMEEDYNINHNFEKELVDELRKLKKEQQ